MNTFKVYPLFDIEIAKGQGSWVWDAKGEKYLDMYGGHAVISIGHSHPKYVEAISNQVSNLGFYSNSVQIPAQERLAESLGRISGREDYNVFYCSSGAEANENALKLASFVTGKKKVISFTGGFHGRTSLAVAATDNSNIVAPVNETENTIILPFNDVEALKSEFEKVENEVACVIIEGIQGIGGINLPTQEFISTIRSLCDSHGALYVADAVQCGYARSGKFFSHDYYGIDADIYSMAKGMGNGFPIGGIMISPNIEAKFGMLGTTFGGNHLACAAGQAVLDVIEEENLIENSRDLGEYLIAQLGAMEGIEEVRGRGLMIGLDLFEEAGPIRKELLFEHNVFTGSAKGKNTVRLLPALNLKKEEADIFLDKLSLVLKKHT